MGKRDRYREHPDPEYQRWGRTYRSFPGVAECVRLILTRKANGAWADIVASELAENARENMAELIDKFRDHESDPVAMFIMMAIEMAAIPESVEFLSCVLREANPLFVPYARRTLVAINTPASRAVLFRAAQAEQSHAPVPTARPVSNAESSPPVQ